MRIVHVSPSFWPTVGGGETHCERVSRGLRARGHEVHIVTSNREEPLGNRPTAPIGSPYELHRDLHVHRIPHRSLAARVLPWFYHLPMPARANARRLLRRSAYRHFGASLLETIRKIKPDVVMGLAQIRIIDGLCEAAQDGKFPLALVPLLHTEDPTTRYDEIGARVRASHVVIANTSVETAVYERLGVASSRIFVGSLGVDMPPESPPPHPREPRVTYLGRKVLAKGIARLIHAMQELWKTHPGARLCLAGAWRPASAEVDAMIAALPPAQRAQVENPYDISEAEKADILRSSTCLVLPSTSESFGLVLLEAWSHGTPVVTFDLPVFHCTVTHDENGLLVPVDDIPAMAGAIRGLIDDPARAASLGQAGHTQASAVHSWDAVAERYERAYEAAIGFHAGTPNAPLEAAGKR